MTSVYTIQENTALSQGWDLYKDGEFHLTIMIAPAIDAHRLCHALNLMTDEDNEAFEADFGSGDE